MPVPPLCDTILLSAIYLRKSQYPLLDPKIDFVFKLIFGTNENKKLLISFLNAVLTLSNDQKVTDLTIENPFVFKEFSEDKLSILDIKAQINHSDFVNVEIQLKNQADLLKRSFYYLCKLYDGQLMKAHDYSNLNKSIIIHILNFNLVKDDTLHHAYLMKEVYTNEVFSDILEIHFLEIPKFDKDTQWDKNNLLQDWIAFLKNPESKEVKMVSEYVKEIEEA